MNWKENKFGKLSFLFGMWFFVGIALLSWLNPPVPIVLWWLTIIVSPFLGLLFGIISKKKREEIWAPGTILSTLIILFYFLLVIAYFAPHGNHRASCESYKAQFAGLCGAKPTEQMCNDLGDLDNTRDTPDKTGKECEWANVSSDLAMINMKCTVKAGIDWANAYPEQCG